MSTINEINFSDIYITPDKVAYIPDGKTANGLMKIKTDVLDDLFVIMTRIYSNSFHNLMRQKMNP